MGRSTRPPLVAELAAFDRLLEIGVGRRPAVARTLAADGHEVVVVDVDPDAVEAAATGTDADAVGDRRDGVGRSDVGEQSGVGERSDLGDWGPFARRASVHDLAAAADPLASLSRPEEPVNRIDAVYARNLPAELQSPTVDLARRLDAACLFTTLGFEEPIVDVDRRSLSDGTLYVARR